MGCILSVITPEVEGRTSRLLQSICTRAIAVGRLENLKGIALPDSDLLNQVTVRSETERGKLERQILLAPELGVGEQAEEVARLGERLGKELIPFLVESGVEVRVRVV